MFRRSISTPKAFCTRFRFPSFRRNSTTSGKRRASLWRKRGTHPHIGMRAGASTLPLVLALHLGASMASAGGFDIDAWLERYAAVMTSEDGHADTFIPSIHRRYFENLAAGKIPKRTAVPTPT